MMNDHDLIDELHEGMRERADSIDVPDGLAACVRRTARRRTAKRAVAVGVPVLAVAGVTTALAVGGGSPELRLSTSAPRGSAPETTAAPVTHARDTAYIVKRVKAKVADDSQGGTVSHSYGYPSGGVSSDGSLVYSGPKSGESYVYTAPDGTAYFHNEALNSDGSPTRTGIAVVGPVTNGRWPDSETLIDNVNHTYTQTHTDESVSTTGASAPPAPTPNVKSSPSQVQQALQDRRVTQMGTTTVNGTTAIALSISTPHVQNVLYVDAQTYQPLRQVIVEDSTDGGRLAAGPQITDWVPATPANIATAKDDSIPAGYTKVANAGG